MRKGLFFLVLSFLLVLSVGCDKNEPPSITSEEAYAIYYDTISRFVPELMTEPQECDINVTTRHEVTFLTEHFVRNLHQEIKSQNVDGKLQYYLWNEFPDANQLDLYFIDGDKFCSINCPLNGRGDLKEWGASKIPALLFPHLNTPLFQHDAIKSFTAEYSGSDTVLSFVIDGGNMDNNFHMRVMREISPTFNDKLDDVTIVLTIDQNGTPKSMSTHLSMSKLRSDGSIFSQKIIDMDFVFNKFESVDFDLQKIVSLHSSDPLW